MDPQLKQRLVGAVSLLVLAILIVPLVLDGPPPGSIYDKAPADIEARNSASRPEPLPRPEFRPPPPPAKVSVAGAKPSDSPAPTRVEPSRESEAATRASAAKESATPTAGGSWTVQVASFGKKSNATALVKRLKKSGFDADIETLKRSSGTLYRVRVGPVAEVGEAKRIRDSVKRNFKLDAIAVRDRG